jgi:hypothetical protein
MDGGANAVSGGVVLFYRIFQRCLVICTISTLLIVWQGVWMIVRCRMQPDTPCPKLERTLRRRRKQTATEAPAPPRWQQAETFNLCNFSSSNQLEKSKTLPVLHRNSKPDIAQVQMPAPTCQIPIRPFAPEPSSDLVPQAAATSTVIPTRLYHGDIWQGKLLRLEIFPRQKFEKIAPVVHFVLHLTRAARLPGTEPTRLATPTALVAPK